MTKILDCFFTLMPTNQPYNLSLMVFSLDEKNNINGRLTIH